MTQCLPHLITGIFTLFQSTGEYWIAKVGLSKIEFKNSLRPLIAKIMCHVGGGSVCNSILRGILHDDYHSLNTKVFRFNDLSHLLHLDLSRFSVLIMSKDYFHLLQFG